MFAIIIIILFYLLLGYRPPWWRRKQNNCYKSIKDIPGPLTLPIIGTRWIYSRLGGYSFTKIHEVYAALYKKYGPIIKEETLFNIPVISIIDRQDIEKVLKSSGKYPVRPPTEAIAHYRKSRPDRYASGGLVNEQGIVWYHLRTGLTTELTSPRTIARFLSQIKEISEDWCSLAKQQRCINKHISDVKPLAERLGLEATCALVLGRRMGFLLPDGISETAKSLAEAVHHHFLACRDTYYGLPIWKLISTSPYRRLVKSEEEIYTLALELIQSADEETRESAVFQSVLRAPVDQREKTAAIVDFIAAGIYTLGNSLIFLLYLVGSYPECQRKLLEDLSSGSTAYLKACISESFRLIPTAFCLARISEQDLELSGYQIKAGTVLLCQTGLACKDENNFKNATKFQPERWLGERKNDTTSTATYLVTPFGIGRRICPGRRFVEQVLGCMLSTIVQQFHISCPKPLQLQFEFILAPKGPIPMHFDDVSF